MKRVSLLAVGVLLLAHSFYMLSLEIFHFGVQVPFFLGLMGLFLAWRWHSVQNWVQAKTWRKWLWQFSWLALAIWLCTVAIFFVYLQRNMQAAAATLATTASPPQAIFILGSGSPHCEPSDVARARLDTGLALAKSYPTAYVAVSGGKLVFQDCTEGEIMATYLREQGIASQRIVQEEESTSTQENMLFTRPLLAVQGVNPETDSIAIVTSHFHTVRALAIAKRAGYKRSFSVGAPMPIAKRYNSWLREYFAYVSGWLLDEY